MGHVIPLHGDRHEEAARLLPWFVTGQLDAADHARVEAHVAECAECQADARSERRLEAGVAGLSFDVERGWAGMREKLDERPAPARWPTRLADTFARPGRAGWLIAAQAIFVIALGALLIPLSDEGRYRALGAVEAPMAGNVVVVFRPETRERDMRRALRASNARLVAGPTDADAYVLAVPAADRTQALARLRGDAGIAMAEPVEPPAP